MSRALVLGGAGFLGLHLAGRLVRDGLAVTIVDDFSRGRADDRLGQLSDHPAVRVVSADLTCRDAWDGLGHGWDQIYLLAAVVGVRNVESDPVRVIRVNTLTVLNLLDWITPGARVFFSSTSEVYAGGVDAGIVAVPTPEDVPVLIADVAAPRSAYAISKLLGEAALLHAVTAKDCAAVVGRFHNVYGPRMGYDHVIPEMTMRALGGADPFVVPGADQYRAFCHVDDAVEAVVRLMDCPAAVGQVVHIGNDRAETNILDLARIILRLAGTTPVLQPLPAPTGSVHRRRPDLTKLRRLTGFEPAVPVSDGVRTTFDSYRDSARPAGVGVR